MFGVSKGMIFAISLALIAYYYSSKSGSSSDEQKVIDAWNAFIQPPQQKFGKVAVGVNACVDLIVRGTQLLEALGIKPGSQSDHTQFTSLQDLQESFHYYLAKGAAVERYFSDGAVFKKIVEEASKLDNIQWHVGGNAALMAQKIVSIFPEVGVMLVGPIGPRLEKLLDQRIQLPNSSLSTEDEVHMILEYGVGDKWGSSVAPVATRLITSHDVSNGELKSLESFFASLEVYMPDLVVMSGLHMLEGQPAKVMTQRLQALSSGLSKIPINIPVHMELASMADAEFLASIVKQIFKKISTVGLNEQELAFIAHAAGGPHDDLINMEGQPPVHKISDIMHWVLTNFARSEKNPNSKLTRIHFHSLTYHIIGYVDGMWTNVESAVAAGARIAGKQACDDPDLISEKLELRLPRIFKLYTGDTEKELNPSEPVMTWKRDGFSYVFSPVLVCRKPVKTVGLGDAISATGLLFSTANKIR